VRKATAPVTIAIANFQPFPSPSFCRKVPKGIPVTSKDIYHSGRCCAGEQYFPLRCRDMKDLADQRAHRATGLDDRSFRAERPNGPSVPMAIAAESGLRGIEALVAAVED
jgi:hypothetical protein